MRNAARVACVLSGVAILVGAAQAQAPGWHIIESQAPYNRIDALSATSVWAAGGRLVGHWDGGAWKPLPPLTFASSLNDVAAISDVDVWAGGAQERGKKLLRPLLAHWDGSTWLTVPNAEFPAGYGAVDSLVALATDDVWALGETDLGNGSGDKLFAKHWDGRNWRSISLPPTQPSTVVVIGDAVALTSTNIWAVGYSDCGLSGCVDPIVLHWNGRRWRSERAAYRGCENVYLQGAAAISATDIWVVGWTSGSDACPPLTYDEAIEHWNGSRWRLVHSPRQASPNGKRSLLGVDGSSAGDVWAVGTAGIEHWDGRRWSVVRAPGIKRPVDVAVVSPTDVWAVGGGLIANYVG